MSDRDRSQTSPLVTPPAPVEPIEKAPFFRDPTFQEFYWNAQAQSEVLEELRRVFAEGRYSINSVSTLCGVHEDAFFLDDIVGGKRRLSELLAVIEKGVPADIFAAMLVDLHRFLAPRLPELTRALPPATEMRQ